MSAAQAPLAVDAARGMAWSFVVSVLGKPLSFFGQWALGLLLAAPQFGTFALASGLFAVVGTLRDAGVQRYVLSRPGAQQEIDGAAYTLALRVNSLTAALLVALSSVVAWYKGDEVLFVTLPMAADVLVGTKNAVVRARLGAELRFSELAGVDLARAIVRTLGMALGAWVGFGVMSFTWVLPVATLVESALLGRTGIRIPSRSQGGPSLVKILGATRWIVLGRVFAGMILQGDYLVLSWVLATSALGAYFFGYQLVHSVVVTIGAGIVSAVMPVMAHLRGSEEQGSEFFVRGLRLVTLVSVPVFFAVGLVAGPAMHLLWGGRWAEAEPVVEALAFVSSLSLLGPYSIAALEAKGAWRLQCWLYALQAMTTLAAASIALFGVSLRVIAVTVGVQHVFHGLLQLVVVRRHSGAPVVPALRAVLGPLSCHGLALAGALLLRFWSSSLSVGVLVFAFAIFSLLASFALQRRAALDLAILLGRLVQRYRIHRAAGGP